ncbi:DUF6049 family protein [Microbacterium sp. bgisy203]|uniref:DUF6049 family protein n=1 Tax=Microbacterium sp. bgisy203 TaxID=3413799 RepID=UPI003D71785F
MTSIAPAAARRARRSAARWTARAASILAAALLLTPAPAAAVPAAVSVAQPSTLSVAVGGDGVVRADQPLTVRLSAQNTSDEPTSTVTVELATSATALSTHDAVSAWLASTDADPARTESPLGTLEVPSAPARGKVTAAVELDPATVAGLAPGVYPLRAWLADQPSESAAVSVLVVPGDTGGGALSVVVPIVAEPAAGGLLSSDELTDLTGPGGDLRVQLDALTGTAVVLAVDPAIVAAIRVLGSSAPPVASTWLDDLLTLPNTRFALQFADADLATQVAAGLTAPLTVTDLTPFMSTSDFTRTPTPTASPTPSESPTTSPTASPTAAASPSPTSTTSPDAPALPSLAELTDIGPTIGTVFWPATGSAGSREVSTLAAPPTPDGTAPLTLVDSTSIDSAPGAVTGGAWADAAGAPLLVYDAATSAALARASLTDAPVERAGALAAASAHAALDAGAAPDAALLVVVDRATTRSAAGLRDTIVTASGLAGRTATDLTALTAGTPEPVSLVDVPVDADRAATAQSLLTGEAEIGAFSSILTDPAVLTSPERAEILQLLAAGWRDRPTQWEVAVDAHREQTTATLGSVALIPQSDITFATTSAPLTFTVRNELPWPVTLTLLTSNDDPRLVVQYATPVQAGPLQNTRIGVPVEARVGSGEATLGLQLRSPTQVAIGDPVTVHVAVRAEWESVGIAVMAVLVGGLIIVGIVRTVRKRRRARRAEAQEASGEAG